MNSDYESEPAEKKADSLSLATESPSVTDADPLKAAELASQTNANAGPPASADALPQSGADALPQSSADSSPQSGAAALEHTDGVLRLYTIGHSNYPIETFIELLRKHQIDVVVDVRSNPYSRYATHFTGAFLKKELLARKFKYVFLGNEVGGKPKEEEFYDADGYADYAKLAQSEKFRSGFERLKKGIQSYRVAIMCAEEDPSHCHRQLLIAKYAHQSGIDVQHIRKTGGTQGYEEIARESAPDEFAMQLSLFNAGQEASGDSGGEVWKSQSRIKDSTE